MRMSKGKIGGIAVGLVIFILLITVLSCMKKVPAGYVGIIYSMNGGISDEVLTQGWHVVSPTKSVTLYSVGIEQSYLTSGEDGDSKNNDSYKNIMDIILLMHRLINSWEKYDY